ncbi:hypothetical protein [Rothia dentocariosa]|uniref:hypothetical protein n=1 Tax=Rothia dentocariosa TaxID=2047 RepID=UPI0015E0CCF2|nr:hypothetical protein [Rothia dentocariosa]
MAIGASAGFASSKKSLDANKELKAPLYSYQEPFYAPSDLIGQTGAEVRKQPGCAPKP